MSYTFATRDYFADLAEHEAFAGASPTINAVGTAVAGSWPVTETTALLYEIDHAINFGVATELERQLGELRGLDDAWADDDSLAPTDASIQMTALLLPALARAVPAVDLVPNVNGYVVVTQRDARGETRVELRSVDLMVVTRVNFAEAEAWNLRAPFNETKAIRFFSFN